MGKYLTSHRYNCLPLLPSGPGGIQQELVVKDLPGGKDKTFIYYWLRFVKSI